MVKKIIRFPNESLRSECKIVDFSSVDKDALREHIRDLKDTLSATPNGLALASNQILPLGFRIFVVKQPSLLPEVIINPTHTPNREFTKMEAEGCLSVPELNTLVERAIRVALTYFDVDGQKYTSVISGLEARIVQHECDHLDGKLIYDYVDKRTQIKIRQLAIKNRKAGK